MKGADANDIGRKRGPNGTRAAFDGASDAFGEGPQPRLCTITADEFLKLELPPRGMILAPWLPEKGLAMIYSPRGMGKTLLALTTGYAIASGAEFLTFSALAPRRVLYLDGEMPASAMQERLKGITSRFERQPPHPSYFKLLSSDLNDRGLPDLGTPEGQIEFDEHVGDAEVIIADNISTLVRSGKENEAEGWAPVQEWALRHRRANRSVLFIHHAGKGGAQRGTSKREDVLDTVIALKRPANYVPDDGARFEVHFEKARGMYGLAAQPFEARYEIRHGAAIWTHTPIKDAELARVVDALRDGQSIREAADSLGMHRSKVERLKKRADEKGILNG